MATDCIDFIDVGTAIAGLDPAYGSAGQTGDANELRVHVLAWSAADRRLYVVFADRFVFWTDDSGRHWHEVAEVNRGADGEPRSGQHVDAIVDTMAGSVLIIGREGTDDTAKGIVWRKARHESAFARNVAAHPGWRTGKSGNATAGYFGTPAREMVAVAIYDSPAEIWYSFDDGLRWQRKDLADVFALHVHEVYLHRSANLNRVARLWVSGGDDPSGRRSGVVTFDASDAGDLTGFRQVLRERPGYRLVGLAGDGKHVYIGNESLAGGALRILDNAQSIAAGDFEYVLGKHRHDYHQFRSMVASGDGLLASASDSYAFVGDTIRADSGGYLYVSSNGGASFREISLGMKWITGLAYDGSAFWLAGGMNRDYGPDASALRATLVRVPKPPAYAPFGDPYCAKALVMDSSGFYEMAGYADHPRPTLAPGERTFRVDLSPFSSIAVDVESYGSATLVVEALPFQNWHPDEDAWRDVATIVLGAGSATAMLPPPATHNRWFRVRNAGDRTVELRRIAFIART